MKLWFCRSPFYQSDYFRKYCRNSLQQNLHCFVTLEIWIPLIHVNFCTYVFISTLINKYRQMKCWYSMEWGIPSPQKQKNCVHACTEEGGWGEKILLLKVKDKLYKLVTSHFFLAEFTSLNNILYCSQIRTRNKKPHKPTVSTDLRIIHQCKKSKCLNWMVKCLSWSRVKRSDSASLSWKDVEIWNK